MLVPMSRVPVQITSVVSTAALLVGAPLLSLGLISAGDDSDQPPAQVALAPPEKGADNRLDTRLQTSHGVMLARPDEGGVFQGRNMKWDAQEAGSSPLCHGSLPICVHWTDDGPSAATLSHAQDTLGAAATSWQVIVEDLNFRAPLPDTRSTVDGGNSKYDIYLADTGSVDLSGYTSSDDSRLSKNSNYRYRDVSAFSVIDNDFRDGQFDNGASQLDRRRAAVAHELFHASQFAYDHAEDLWLVEGTAAWIEEQVFDSVNLNRAWLKRGPLSRNFDPLDLGRNGNQYGSWAFFQYLSERYGAGFVRQIWRYADDSPQQRGDKRTQTYSMRAVARALNQRDKSLANVFAAFARDNLRPGRAYEEGESFPRPDVVPFLLDRRSDDTGWLGLGLRHLSSAYVSFRPSNDAPRVGQVRISANGPDRRFYPRFWVTVQFKSGKIDHRSVRLGKHGDGSVRVSFGRKKVAAVDVSMVNASGRMSKCWKRDTPFSCSGRPLDEGKNYKIRARLS